MEQFGQFARFLAAAGLATVLGAVHAQTLGRDGIDRDLLQRQQAEREFHVKLYDSPSGSPGSKVTVTLPIPRQFTDRESYERTSADTGGTAAAGPVPPGSAVSPKLDDSQLRRQLELQIQTRSLDDVARQQQSQIQQSQFGRENQAQDLNQSILRNSSDSMQRLR